MSNRSLTESGRHNVMEQIKKHITQLEGEVKEIALGGLVALETPIKKSTQCWYECIFFSLNPDKVAELRMELKVLEGVDRYQIISNHTDDRRKATFDVLSEKDYRKREFKFWQENVIMENPQILKFFLSPRGRIMPAKVASGLIGSESSAMMRQLSNAVKQARFMGWLRLK